VHRFIFSVVLVLVGSFIYENMNLDMVFKEIFANNEIIQEPVNEVSSVASVKGALSLDVPFTYSESFAHEALAKQLKDKTSLRKYVALVHGNISHEKGTITAPIGRSKVNRKMQAVIEDGKPAVTHFTVLERFDQFTLVELQLETGRTHQIRVHMQYIGFPLAGDPVYGPKKTLKGNGPFLHAKLLGFTHPTTGENMVFEAPLPALFEETLKKLRKND